MSLPNYKQKIVNLGLLHKLITVDITTPAVHKNYYDRLDFCCTLICQLPLNK